MNENKRIKMDNIEMKLKLFKMKAHFNNTKGIVKDLEEQIDIRDLIIEK